MRIFSRLTWTAAGCFTALLPLTLGYQMPSTSITSSSSRPRLHLEITPTWNGSIGQTLETALTIGSPELDPDTAFLEMIMTAGNVPSMNYTGSDRILATDAHGSFDLLVTDEDWPVRRWHVTRPTKGDVRLEFTGRVRHTTKSTPPGPRIDIRENSGGLLATGHVFIPTVLPDRKSTERGEDDRTALYEITVSWDMSKTPTELSAKTVWTFGEGMHVTRTGQSCELINTVYGVAPSASFHSWLDPTQPNFGLYWFTEPSPRVLSSPSILGEGIASLLPVMSRFFNTTPTDLTYRVFLRESPRGHGGGAYDWSFILEWDEDINLGQADYARVLTYHLIAHEMVHNWPTMEGAPDGQEDANSTWYEEGIASYYEAILPFRSGLISTEQFLSHLNEQLSAYYTSPAINMTTAEAATKAWSDTHAQRSPYYRGTLYLLHLEAEIVARERGHTLREPVLNLLELQKAGKAFGFPEWMELMDREGIHSFAEETFGHMSQGGWIVPPPAGLFGENIIPVRVDRPVFERGYDLVIEDDRRFIRNVIPGSRAQDAGFEDGDEVIPGPYSNTAMDNPEGTDYYTVKKIGSGEIKTIEYWPRTWHTVESWEYREVIAGGGNEGSDRAPAKCERRSQPILETLLSLSLILGLVVSYLPQHIRIIRTKSSEGFSPWYLLLGSTSGASGMLNVVILQANVIRCCKIVSSTSCFISLLPLVQVSLVWLLFSLNLVLYLIYFPVHHKYAGVIDLPSDVDGDVDERTSLLSHGGLERSHAGATQDRAGVEEGLRNSVVTGRGKVHLETTKEWKLAVTLAVVVALHLALLAILSLALLHYLPPTHPLLSTFPRFLGLSSMFLAFLQYAPQLVRTYQLRLVGALSISTMAIQCPGSALFVLSLALAGGGVDWSSWITYAVSGTMQGVLLIMCLAWKRRQSRLGQDDFGRSLLVSDGL